MIRAEDVDRKAWLKQAIPLIDYVAEHAGVPAGRSGADLLFRCPFHDDSSPSLRVNASKGVWICDPCKAGGGVGGGDLITFEQRRTGATFNDAVLSLLRDPRAARVAPAPREPSQARARPAGRSQGHVVATYSYTDATGAVVARKARIEPGKDGRSKRFAWRHSDGTNGQPSGVTLYRLHEVAAAVREGGTVWVVEGEKCVDALAALGLAATTNANGAGKWTAADAAHLTGANVIVLADNDEPGRRHADAVVASLTDGAHRVHRVELPNLPPKGDVVDWLAAGGTRTELERLAAQSDNQGAAHGLVCLADVEVEEVKWLWRGRIPYGKLTVLDGDPGLGKSTLTLDLAARLSAGRPLPDGEPVEPAAVLLVGAEDGLGDTIKPRLHAAGANQARVFALATVTELDGAVRGLALPDDVNRIEAVVRAHGVRLVVIDPLSAFLGARVDSFKDQDVRRALHPLVDMANRTGAAFLLVRHLNKSGTGNALYRGGGSIAIIGAARSGLLVGRDPDDQTRRVLASTKCNLAAEPPSLSFSAETIGNVPRITWHGASEHHAGALVALPGSEEERTARTEARTFLSSLLDERGGQVDVKEARALCRAVGISDRTMDRARSDLGVESVRLLFGGKYVWRYAAKPSSPPCRDGVHGEQDDVGGQADFTTQSGPLVRQSLMFAASPPAADDDAIEDLWGQR